MMSKRRVNGGGLQNNYVAKRRRARRTTLSDTKALGCLGKAERKGNGIFVQIHGVVGPSLASRATWPRPNLGGGVPCYASDAEAAQGVAKIETRAPGLPPRSRLRTTGDVSISSNSRQVAGPTLV